MRQASPLAPAGAGYMPWLITPAAGKTVHAPGAGTGIYGLARTMGVPGRRRRRARREDTDSRGMCGPEIRKLCGFWRVSPVRWDMHAGWV